MGRLGPSVGFVALGCFSVSIFNLSSTSYLAPNLPSCLRRTFIMVTRLDTTRRFCRQVLQAWPELSFPSNEELLQNQEALYRELFADGARPFPPPKHYQLRVLKELVGRIEGSIEDWDRHVRPARPVAAVPALNHQLIAVRRMSRTI